MALKNWKCQVCNETFGSFDAAPEHCEKPAKVCFHAPQAKFMEPRPGKPGKSILKNQNKILKARTREHSRNFELDELIANNSEVLAKQNQWITDKGRKRTRIDDI